MLQITIIRNQQNSIYGCVADLEDQIAYHMREDIGFYPSILVFPYAFRCSTVEKTSCQFTRGKTKKAAIDWSAALMPPTSLAQPK